MIAAILLATLAVAPSQDTSPPQTTRFVSARTGSDRDGDGSEAAPWRSLHRALGALAEGDESALIRVDVGRYDEASGEQFPLRVPSGVRIRGLTSTYTRLVAPEGSLALVVQSGERPIRLEDLGIEGAAVAIEVRAGGAAPVHLQDLDLAPGGVGVQVVEEADRPPLHLVLRSLRVRAGEVGLRIQAPRGSRFEAEDCVLRGGRIGLEWIDPRQEGEPAPEGGGSLRRCSLLDATQTGLLRRAVEPSAAAGLRLDACRFERCGTGLTVESNSGSAPLWVQGCAFLENPIFGLRLVGGLPTSQPCRIEDCTLRWNGVGIQVLSPRNPVSIERCRLIDNLGAGVSLGSFATQPARTRLDSCLIADNGAAGVLALADGHQLLVELRACTVTANHGAGLENVSKRSGTATWAVQDCILAGNTVAEVAGLGPAAFSTTLLGRRPDSEAWEGPRQDGLWFGKPGFVDPLNRLWSLREGSMARGRAALVGEGRPDVQGRARPAQGADLGAIQSGGRP